MWAALIGVALAVGCSTAEGSSVAEPAAQSSVVSVQIFSGRPDPAWTLPEDSKAELEEQLGALWESTSSASPPDGGLGFRGIAVSNVATPFGQASAVILGVDAVYLTLINGDTKVLDDPESSSIRVLLPDIEVNVDPGLVSEIEAALDN